RPRTARTPIEGIYLTEMVIRNHFRQLLNMKPPGPRFVDQKITVEHLTQKQVEDYSRNQVLATELLAVSDHLDECDLCRRRVEAGLNGDGTFFALRDDTFGEDGLSTAHLTCDQTAEYVDKNLSGEALQVVTDHLGSCEQCVLAVEDLRAFRNEIAPSLDREFRPAGVAVATGTSWRDRFVSLFRVAP